MQNSQPIYQMVASASIDAERAVIGAIIIDPSVLAEVEAILTPADFYAVTLGKTFDIMLKLRADNKAIDLVTVDQELRARGYQQPTAADLAGYSDNALPSSVVTYAGIVKEASVRRAMTAALQAGLAKLNDLNEPAKSVADDVAGRILQIGAEQRREFVLISKMTVATLNSIERAAREDITDAVPTGLKSIDKKIGGLFRGQLIIIAGRPSMGKTAIATTIAKGAAKLGHAVAVVSCESPTNSLVMRMISSASGVENIKLRTGKLADQDYPKISFAAGQVSSLPIYLYDRERNWEAIRGATRALKIKRPELALVILDYIQLLRVRSRDDRWQQLGQVSAESKELALELDLPFVLLSQINRQAEARADKRPTLGDLRESGNLEQDADVVGLLYRAHYYDLSEPKDGAEINIGKNRDGATGVADLIFDAKTASFSDPPEYATPEQESFL